MLPMRQANFVDFELFCNPIPGKMGGFLGEKRDQSQQSMLNRKSSLRANEIVLSEPRERQILGSRSRCLILANEDANSNIPPMVIR